MRIVSKSPQQVVAAKLAKAVWGFRSWGNLVGERDALIEYMLLLDKRLDEVKNLILQHGASTRK